MPYVVMDMINNTYFTDCDPQRQITTNVSHATVFDTYEQAYSVSMDIGKRFNAQYATYMVLFRNGKWDPTWPAPKQYRWRPKEINKNLKTKPEI